MPSFHCTIARGGRLAGTGRLSFFASLFLRHARGRNSDSIWYQLGRRKGIKVLQLLCKSRFEPDSCVSAPRPFFRSRAHAPLLLANLSRACARSHPPRRLFHMRPERFIFLRCSWVRSCGPALFLGLGYYIQRSDRTRRRVSLLSRRMAPGLLLGVLAAYLRISLSPASAFCVNCVISRITVDD